MDLRTSRDRERRLRHECPAGALSSARRNPMVVGSRPVMTRSLSIPVTATESVLKDRARCEAREKRSWKKRNHRAPTYGKTNRGFLVHSRRPGWSPDGVQENDPIHRIRPDGVRTVSGKSIRPGLLENRGSGSPRRRVLFPRRARPSDRPRWRIRPRERADLSSSDPITSRERFSRNTPEGLRKDSGTNPENIRTGCRDAAGALVAPQRRRGARGLAEERSRRRPQAYPRAHPPSAPLPASPRPPRNISGADPECLRRIWHRNGGAEAPATVERRDRIAARKPRGKTERTEPSRAEREF